MSKFSKCFDDRGIAWGQADSFKFPDKAAMPSKTKATFNDKEFMKNKDRIEQLEKQVAVLENLVHILQMKTTPRVPVTAPVEYPTWKPFWTDGPLYPSDGPKPYRIIPMMDSTASIMPC